jgi:hypothetical protein
VAEEYETVVEIDKSPAQALVEVLHHETKKNSQI